MANTMLYIRGRVVHSPTRGEVAIHDDAFLAIDRASGRIATFHPAIEPADEELINASPREDTLILHPHEFLLPGFVDTHVHAPQYQFAGTGTDTPLMQWLTKYTFPVEASFADVAIANEWYTKLVQRMLSEGITTAQYFATIHVPATQRFVEILEAHGQRAFVGLVSMDQNAPTNYVSPSTGQCLADATAFVEWTLARKNPLIQPVVTPRFIPTCSLELLRGLGDLAERYNVRIQSHAAESIDEEAFVESLHPGRRDTEIFKENKLLNDRSCMAHAVHLTDSELETFAECGASVAHCPLSNFFFANGFLDLHKCWEKSVSVGLGTDIAGGYSPSMLRAMQTAVLTSKALEITRPPTTYKAIDYKDALWLATMGGSLALGIDKEVGSFEEGKSFDAIVVDGTGPGNVDLSPRDSAIDVIQKVVHNGDARNFKRVYVSGKVVHESVA